MFHEILLTLHLAAVGALLFAAGSEYGIAKRVFEARRKEEAWKLSRLPKWEAVNIAAVLLILLTGLLMVLGSPFAGFTTPWVAVSIVLTVGFAAYAGITGEQVKKVAHAEFAFAQDTEEITPRLKQAAKRSLRVTVMGLAVVAGLFVLMVFKPGGLAALAIALISVLTGFLVCGVFMTSQLHAPESEQAAD